MSKRVVAVTGATGYVGGGLAAGLSGRGHDIVALTRRPPAPPSWRHCPFDLSGAPPSADQLRRLGVSALIHCAWDFSPKAGAINRAAARGLVAQAIDAGVERLILISTMSAFTGCVSAYGRAKLDVEAVFLQAGGLVVRPGLVWGGATGGMVGTLTKLVGLPIVPLIGDGSQTLYLTHQEDLTALVDAGLAGLAGRVVTAAAPQPRSFRSILATLAAAGNRRPVWLPVPWPLLWAAVKMVEVATGGRRLRVDSLTGLVHADPAPVFSPAVLRQWGVAEFRPFPDIFPVAG